MSFRFISPMNNSTKLKLSVLAILFLISARAFPAFASGESVAPLCMAARMSPTNVPAVEALLGSGASVSSSCPADVIMGKNVSIDAPVTYFVIQSGFDAGAEKIAIEILSSPKQFPFDVDMQFVKSRYNTRWANSFLGYAAGSASERVLMSLLALRPKLEFGSYFEHCAQRCSPGSPGETVGKTSPLGLAIQNRRWQNAKILIESGANCQFVESWTGVQHSAKGLVDEMTSSPWQTSKPPASFVDFLVARGCT
jgi:hypothetical protein